MVFRVLTFLLLAIEIALGLSSLTWPMVAAHGLAAASAFLWLRRVPAGDLLWPTRIGFLLQFPVAIAVTPLAELGFLSVAPPLVLLFLCVMISYRNARARELEVIAARQAAPLELRPYRATTTLMRVVASLLGAQILTDLIVLAGRVRQAMLMRGDGDALDAFDTIDLIDKVVQPVGLLHVAFYIATGICFLVWLHRVHRNLPALGSNDRSMTPGEAVRGWFIPFVNLVRGYRSVRMAWVESQPPAVMPGGVTLPRSTALLGWWWGLYIANNILARAMPQTTPTIDAFLEAVPFWALGTAVNTIAATLAILVVVKLERRQRDAWDDIQRRVPVPPESDRLR